MLTVSVAAAVTDLTTVTAVKDALALTSSDEDNWIATQIQSVTQRVAAYLNIIPAQDGTVTLGRETLVETIRINKPRPGWVQRLEGERPEQIILSRFPVVSITSVIEDGDTTLAADYEFDGSSGLLRRLRDDLESDWRSRKVVVTYVAGWLLPDQDGRNLPYDIEDAVIDVIKDERHERTRDTAIRSEYVVDVIRTEYAPQHPSVTGLSQKAEAILANYRNVRV